MFISPPERTFGQSMTERIILLAIAGFVLLMTLIVGDFDVAHLSQTSLIVIFLTFGILGLAWWLIAKRTVSFHPEGIQISNAFGAKEMTWEETQETVFSKQDQNLYVHFGLIGLIFAAAASRQGDTMSGGLLTLEIRGGMPRRKLKIGSSVKHADQAIRQVLNRVNPNLKSEFQRQLNNGQTIYFGPVSLSRQGIGFKEKPQVPFAEATIKFNGSQFTVKQTGKWLNAVSTRAQKLPNVFVLLDLAEEFKLGGQSRPPDPLAHMMR